MKKKKIRPICKNCLLYNTQKQHCNVVVLYEGQKINPPTSPNDHCLFDETYQSIDAKGKAELWKPQINEVKLWCEDANGNKAAKGTVKIEYPEGFFGVEE